MSKTRKGSKTPCSSKSQSPARSRPTWQNGRPLSPLTELKLLNELFRNGTAKLPRFQPGQFNPANLMAQPIQMVRFPALLLACAPGEQEHENMTSMSVAPFTAILATDCSGNVIHGDEQWVERFGSPCVPQTSVAYSPKYVKGRVHIQCRFLTWCYTDVHSAPLIRPAPNFGSHAVNMWPLAPTFESTLAIKDPDGFYDLDQWLEQPTVNFMSIPATLREHWYNQRNTDGTMVFEPAAIVPNFNIELLTNDQGAWLDAKISSFFSIQSSTGHSAEDRECPLIDLGFEYRVIGWKAGTR